MLTIGSCNGSGTNFPRVLTMKWLVLMATFVVSILTVDF